MLFFTVAFSATWFVVVRVIRATDGAWNNVVRSNWILGCAKMSAVGTGSIVDLVPLRDGAVYRIVVRPGGLARGMHLLTRCRSGTDPTQPHWHPGTPLAGTWLRLALRALPTMPERA